MALSGTVLGIHGPEGANLGARVVWYRFRTLRRYPAYRPHESARIGLLSDLASTGDPWAWACSPLCT